MPTSMSTPGDQEHHFLIRKMRSVDRIGGIMDIGHSGPTYCDWYSAN